MKYRKVTYQKISPPLFDDLPATVEQAPGLVSQFADGGDLTHKLGSLNSEEAAKFTHNILDGLAYLKEQGLMHRDLKPDNFLIKDGELLFSDYGLMEDCSENQPLSRRGTTAYMPPELFEGSSRTTEGWEKDFPKVDNFAAGMVLLEIATRGEFKNTGPKKGQALALGYAESADDSTPIFNTEQLTSLQTHLRELDNPLAEAIAGLIDPDPEKRFSLEDVEHLLQGQDLEQLLKEPISVPDSTGIQSSSDSASDSDSFDWDESV